jgi:hypothetical protein
VNESKGFIKLYRSLLDWEWFNDNNTFRLFVYCLLKANYVDTKWRGIDVERGSFITSYNKLSTGTGLTIQQVRTSLNKLLSTGELTHKSHSKYSVISINNYEQYQESNTQPNKQVTNKQQTNNKQITTDNKDKKEIIKEKKKKIHTHVFITQTEFDTLMHEYGAELVAGYVQRLDEYIGIKGVKYKSHYLVLRKWMRENPNPKWLSELKREQEQHDAKVFEPKRDANTVKDLFSKL